MPLDESIDEGQAGHIADHETIAATLNDLPTTYAPLAGTPEAYGAGWDGDNGYATKNDVYDKIETIGSSSFVDSEGSMHAGIDNRYRFADEFGPDEGYDEEFDGANIADDTFPTDWSDLSLEAAAVYRQAFGAGRIDWAGGGDATNVQAIGRTLPATTTFTAYCHLAGLTDNEAGTYTAAMVLYRATNGDFIQLGAFNPSGAADDLMDFYVSHYADNDTSTTTIAGPINAGVNIGSRCYFRIDKTSDSDYDFYVSPDGLCWFTVASNINVNATYLGGDPSHIGFALNTPGASHVGCEWLRIRGVT